MATLKDCQVQPSEVFQVNIMTNMNFGLSRYLKSKGANEKADAQNYKKLRYRYWRTLGELLETIPPGQLNENFPIIGLEHFTQVYAQGKGVILLTFHGMPRPEGFFPLERHLGLEQIPTISYHTPRRKNRHDKKENKLSEAAAAAMNAQVALLGQSKLLAGKVINIVSDTNDKQGRTHQVVVAGRIFHMKAGFAELALNTGARIIPHFRYCLPDGRIQLSLGAPLESGSGERHEQVENLLNEYASFIENTWSVHPESLSWVRIRRHLSRPLAEHKN